MNSKNDSNQYGVVFGHYKLEMTHEWQYLGLYIFQAKKRQPARYENKFSPNYSHPAQKYLKVVLLTYKVNALRSVENWSYIIFLQLSK